MAGANGNLDAAQLTSATARRRDDTVPRVGGSDRADVPRAHGAERRANQRVQLHDEHVRRRHGECGRRARRGAAADRGVCRRLRRSPPGQTVNLSGAGSAGACNRTIASYFWEVVGGTGVLTGPNNTPTTSVNAPATGSFTVRLTVTDDVGEQDSADIEIALDEHGHVGARRRRQQRVPGGRDAARAISDRCRRRR